MFSNRLAFAGLSAACIAAAAGGGYLASRQNAIPAPAAAMTAPLTPAASDNPVHETEAVVGDAGLTAPATLGTLGTSTIARPSAPGASARVSQAPAPKRVESGARPSAAASANTSAAPAPPSLDRTWPTSAAAQTAAASTNDTSEPAERTEAIQEAPRAPEPPQKYFEELVVSADSVIGLQIENRVSSETARVEDRVEARVTRDVKVADKVAIPAGARAVGSVTQVERGGKFKERARLAVRFHTLVLADGTRLPMNTETIYRDGDAPGNSSAAKIGGGAVGGAILGAILGGAKGAAIGATAGAGGGAAAVVAGDSSTATLQPGTSMTVRVLSPITVTVEQE